MPFRHHLHLPLSHPHPRQPPAAIRVLLPHPRHHNQAFLISSGVSSSNSSNKKESHSHSHR